MTNSRILELLEIEQECIKRNHDHKCDRDCGRCDLVQEDEELIEMYEEVIKNYYVKVHKKAKGQPWEQKIISSQMMDDLF